MEEYNIGDGRRRRLGAVTAANWKAAHRTAAQRKAAQRKAAQRRSGRRRRSGQRSSGAHHLTRRGLRGGLRGVSTTYRARVARPRGYANNAAQPNHMTVGLSSIRWTDAQRRAAQRKSVNGSGRFHARSELQKLGVQASTGHTRYAAPWFSCHPFALASCSLSQATSRAYVMCIGHRREAK